MDGEEKDRISLLPDCLLLEIISRLPTTKHAILTSTLSKRWQHLWTFLPNLIFIESKDVCKRVDGYSSFIDKTLTRCPTHVNLNKFELNMSSDSSDFNSSQLNRWIRYAITRNVQEVDIELPCGGVGLSSNDDDFFFKNLCATKMKLRSCKFIHPVGVISWEKLKCLCISVGIVHEDLIANILSGSPCLKTLELDHCYGFSSINVTSKSVKNLVLSNYDYTIFGEKRDCIASIKIDAPYILSLTIRYTINLREILLLNVSSLVKADLDYWLSESGLEEEEEELLKGLIQSLLPRVGSVTIGYFTLKVLKRLDAKGFELLNGEDDSD